ncbi:MAG: Rdx family protein [Gemmatimonadota bacterium]
MRPSPTPGASTVSIESCTRCRRVRRASWYAQGLLTFFQGELCEIAGDSPGSLPGVFEVRNVRVL